MPPSQRPLNFFARRPVGPTPPGTAPVTSGTGLTSDPFVPIPQSARVLASTPAPPQRVLAVEIPPATLRPIAFRVFTKKHNLTLKSDALALLASFVGRKCGAEWRNSGSGEVLLDKIARQWKRTEGAGKILVDGGPGLQAVLKSLEPEKGRPGKMPGLKKVDTMELRMGEPIPTSQVLGDHEDTEMGDSQNQSQPLDTAQLQLIDSSEYLKVVDAFEQPRMLYNPTRKHFERHPKPSLLPSPASKTTLFRHRYHVLHSRLLRNESFQAPTYSKTPTSTSVYKITPISALLGRAGQSFLLFGLLSVSPSGTLSLYDPTGELPLDITHCAPVSAIFLVPGMFLLLDGMFEDSGVFTVFTVVSPPPERRAASAEVFGHVDFLGAGVPLDFSASGGGAGGRALRKLERTLDERFVIVGELPLDNPRSLPALRTILESYADPPKVLVLFGSFCTTPFNPLSPETTRIYKENFDALGALLATFPEICAKTTLVLIPGDNDPWSSTFSAGSSPPFPRPGIPNAFLPKLRRVIPKLSTPSNPCRLSFFTSELVFCRDSLHSRFQRNSITVPASSGPDAPPPPKDVEEADKMVSRKIVKSVLDQGWLAPFALDKRPVLWDFAVQGCAVYPLPTAMVWCDTGVQPWTVTYEGCRTMNVGIAADRREVRWGEWGVKEGVAVVKRKDFNG